MCSGDLHRPPRNNGGGYGTFATAPEYPPFNPQGQFPLGAPQYHGPQGNPQGQTGAYRGYGAYGAAQNEDELNEDDPEGDEFDGHGPPRRQYENSRFQAGGRHPNQGRPHPTVQPRRRTPPQGPGRVYMSGAMPRDDLPGDGSPRDGSQG